MVGVPSLAGFAFVAVSAISDGLAWAVDANGRGLWRRGADRPLKV
jgi:hypothetical protein